MSAPGYRPWSLRELAGELAAGATTPTAALARARDRVAATDERLRAWVVPPAPPGSDRKSVV